MIDIEYNEHKILEVRKHWFDLLYHVVITMIIGFIPPVVFAFFGSVPTKIEFAGNHFIAALFICILWFMLTWIILFFIWTDYYLDVWIITDQKIVSVDQKGLFMREIATLQLDKIQDVTVEVNGLIPTLFHFGDIHVQTAGENREFVMLQIAQPQKIKDQISHVIEQYNRQHSGFKG